VALVRALVGSACRARGAAATLDVIPEVTTVADDAAVVFVGAQARRYHDLEPDTDYTFDGVSFRTLPRPAGERLATVCAVNDVHFGETEAGVIEGADVGEVFRSEPGEEPYPEVMNRGAVAEMRSLDPPADAVVVKGDLTATGTRAEYQAFLDCYGPAFGTRLHHVWGNHDGYYGERFADAGMQQVDVPGARLAILDTVIPRSATGGISGDQLEWLDELGARSSADGLPVLVFGHHHPWSPDSATREPTYFGINPDDSEALVDVVARRPALLGYFAGHTHRNRVRRFSATGDVPWVEVACVKDFPGAWAEYRVFEGGILQVFHRISTPDALAWSEKTRGMFGGAYPFYAFGEVSDRNFPIWPR
jgi:predicted phosphodiesterase